MRPWQSMVATLAPIDSPVFGRTAKAIDSGISLDCSMVAEEAITNTRECLAVFAQKHPGATFVVETGTHSPWVSRLVTASP